ncbi:hypothetical protein [Dolichospermum flos-aquae]|uniref:hypothetical protein n=1 Tax=Dolichospermum flosaquae TaxID=1166 RepID=UPI00187EE99E|nr:hypothetical protein [Dolichospermum flos-aquae]
MSPHWLGTLIEWKRHDIECLSHKIVHLSHWLGTLIEWKPDDQTHVRANGRSPLHGDIN